MASLAYCMTFQSVYGQSELKVDHELWFFSYNYFKINDKATFNQDVSYQQSLGKYTPKRFSVKSQFNYSLSSIVSLHGGLAFYFKDNRHLPNSQEIRPWQGVKLRWPSFWRLDFSHYMKFEERFEHLLAGTPWSTHFRIRYKLSTALPINKAAIIDHTVYLSLAYQYVSASFDKEFAHKHTDYQRYEMGLASNSIRSRG